MDAWNTQLAAYIRSTGIVILLFKNQTPTVSATTKTIIAKTIWINKEVEKILIDSIPDNPINEIIVEEMLDIIKEYNKVKNML